MVCDRAWVYTAISRARKACVLIGRQTALREMVARVKIDKRKTFLVDSIRAALVTLRESEGGGDEVSVSAPAEDAESG
jgi:superfamily I DNA and RNA helicase